MDGMAILPQHFGHGRTETATAENRYIMAGLGVLSAAASYLVGDVDLLTAANAAFSAAAVAFLRAGIPRL